MEIIAIPSYRDGGLNEIVHPKFGRCDSFTFITLENDEITEVKVIENAAADERHGSGTLAAKIISKNNAQKLIVNKLGPNASMALDLQKIKTFRAPEKKIMVKDLLDLYLKGKIRQTPSELLINSSDLE
ncbi:MAG: NifB/NifX family molybdenum-iron cluster-binding protein [Candidatus Hermodarchaeota archaeon]